MPQQKESDDREFVRHDLPAGSSDPKKSRAPRRSASSERMAVKKRMEEHRVDEQLAEIYAEKRGGRGMMRVERPHSRRLVRSMFMLLFACFFLAAVAWVGFFVLQPPQHFSEEDIALSISGDQSVRIGQPAKYRIHYRNADRIALQNAILQVRYPEAFVFEKSSKQARNDANDEWDLGVVGADESGDIEIVGHLFGDIGDKQSLRAFFNYRPANFSADFQKVATFTTSLGESPVSVSIDMNTEASVGTLTDITIHVVVASGTPVGALSAMLNGGDSFAKKTAKPADLPDHPNVWKVNAFSGETAIAVKGIFTPPVDQKTADVSVVVRGWPTALRAGDGVIMASTTRSVSLVRSDLGITMAINGTLSDFAVMPGDMLSASMIVKNSGQTAIKNVVARAVFDAPSANKQSMLKWSAIDDPSDGAVSGEQLNETTRRGTIVWDKKTVKGLASIDPGAEVEIDFHIPIKKSDDMDLTEFTTADIIASGAVQYDASGQKQIISSNPIRMTLSSDTSFGVKDTVGSSKDGKEKHAISWVIGNSFHELKNIRVEGDFYGDVLWDPSVSPPAGHIAYDEKAKHLVWTVDSMPTTVDVLALQFPIILNTKNPTQTALASKVTFSATDAVSGAQILKAGDEVLLKSE